MGQYRQYKILVSAEIKGENPRTAKRVPEDIPEDGPTAVKLLVPELKGSAILMEEFKILLRVCIQPV